MKITRHLTVDQLEIRHQTEGKYVLTLVDPAAWDVKSTLTLRPEDMARFDLEPGEDLVGAELEIALTATDYAPEAGSPHLLLITELTASEEVHHHYSRIPPDKTTLQPYRLGLRTPVAGGTLVVLPPVYHELVLPLTREEYEVLKGLPAPAAFELHLKPAPPLSA